MKPMSNVDVYAICQELKDILIDSRIKLTSPPRILFSYDSTWLARAGWT
jgi:hypothetical protein